MPPHVPVPVPVRVSGGPQGCVPLRNGSCSSHVTGVPRRHLHGLHVLASSGVFLKRKLEGSVSSVLKYRRVERYPCVCGGTFREDRRGFTNKRRVLAVAIGAAENNGEGNGAPGGKANNLAVRRPENLRRSLVHVAMGLVCVFITEAFAQTHARRVMIAAPISAAIWLWEGLRRVDCLGGDRWDVLTFGAHHAHEVQKPKQITSFAWFALAMAVLALFAPRVICSASMLALAVGDPSAAFVGRRFGTTSLGRNNKTLEGCVGFFVAGFVVISLFATVLYKSVVSLSTLGLFSAAVSFAGAAAEVLSGSRWVDDNFAVPLLAGLAGWCVLHVMNATAVLVL
ncbi:kinase [Pseudoscourfieldia marina]